MSRPDWNRYFMWQAIVASTRATCDRRLVGAVLVRDNRVLTTGYNGSIMGGKHCDDDGHLMRDDHCVRTVHAEMNAVIAAARHGVSTDGATLYVTCYPCWNCFKMLANAGIRRIVYENSYRVDPLVADGAVVMGMELEQVGMDPGDVATLIAALKDTSGIPVGGDS